MKVFRIELTFLLVLVLTACSEHNRANIEYPDNQPYVIVLGIAQDAGFPQADCQKECCASAWNDLSKRRMVSCIGIVDPISKKCWMIDATPDFRDQLRLLQTHARHAFSFEGVALTHAHIGHYTGLMHLGREVMGASAIPVYAMPQMKSFLSSNGPWSQLVDLQNIDLIELKHDSTTILNNRLSLKPFLVPHRDEFSETVGFEVIGQNKSLIFIPDIDKWSKWNEDLIVEIRNHDFVLIDGSFYANGEIAGRDMSEIPHPFVLETMNMLEHLSDSDKNKVHFVHLNHTNPILNTASVEYQHVIDSGFNVCYEEQYFEL